MGTDRRSFLRAAGRSLVLGAGSVWSASASAQAQAPASPVSFPGIANPLEGGVDAIATGYIWTEGPVWVGGEGGHLLFSDVPGNAIYSWDGKRTTVFLAPSGYQGFPIPGSQDSCGLPFFKNFYAGGPGSVRGFTTNTLGPTTIFGGFSQVQPLGGAVKTTGTFEFYFPRLLGGMQGSRISAFIDYGNVFARPGDFEFNQFRITTGLALQWQSPVGPISISYAIPVDYGRCGGRDDLLLCEPDDVERLQFTFGNQQ